MSSSPWRPAYQGRESCLLSDKHSYLVDKQRDTVFFGTSRCFSRSIARGAAGDIHVPVMRLRLNCLVLSKQVVFEVATPTKFEAIPPLRCPYPPAFQASGVPSSPVQLSPQGNTAAARGSQGRRCQNPSVESRNHFGEDEDQGDQDNGVHQSEAGASDSSGRSLALRACIFAIRFLPPARFEGERGGLTSSDTYFWDNDNAEAQKDAGY